MDNSILTTVKKSLGLDENYTAFDPDILMLINSFLSTLNQIGVGPAEGFQIEDKVVTWDDFLGADPRSNNVKTYVHLKVRMIFDPPPTSFAIAAIEAQVKELETRIYLAREVDTWLESEEANA